MMKTSNTISTSGFGQADSVMVRLARFLLRLIVLIGITMVIYAGIRIALALGDKGKLTSALKLLGQVVLGILLALSSVMIIYLVTALMRSSLNFFG
ncbi:MAG: hypothetical protein H6765_05380 [Candidatus Peribacteria bacterium]|nr:MAG: hypothetical protein H6765_05380 [Candidatus Peribacteria bacterium]